MTWEEQQRREQLNLSQPNDDQTLIPYFSVADTCRRIRLIVSDSRP